MVFDASKVHIEVHITYRASIIRLLTPYLPNFIKAILLLISKYYKKLISLSAYLISQHSLGGSLLLYCLLFSLSRKCSYGNLSQTVYHPPALNCVQQLALPHYSSPQSILFSSPCYFK